jgi:hypothetical protein
MPREASTKTAEKRADFELVQAVLRGEKSIPLDPRAAKTMLLLTLEPQDAFLSPTGFNGHTSTGGRTQYFSYVGPMVVTELMKQLAIVHVDGPVVGTFTRLLVGHAEETKYAAAVWIVPSEVTVRLALRPIPEGTPPSNHVVPADGPWRLPPPFERRPPSVRPNPNPLLTGEGREPKGLRGAVNDPRANTLTRCVASRRSRPLPSGEASDQPGVR